MDPEPVLISLGSNIDPERHLPRAVALLGRRVTVRAASGVYETEPVEATGPAFLNAAVLIETGLAPEELKFGVLRRLEERLGRVRTGDPGAPRTIDLDIALYGSRVVDRPDRNLRIPDPDICRRAYLARCLAEIAPELRHPLTGQTLLAIAGSLADQPAPRRRDDVLLRF